MPVVERPQAQGEGSPRRAAPKEIQVRLARTVRRPEPGQGDGRPRQRPEALRPLVLPRPGVMALPDLFRIGVRPQVVNVPVGVAARLQMMRKPGAEAPGAVGAADVDVESGLKLQAAKLADSGGRSFD